MGFEGEKHLEVRAGEASSRYGWPTCLTKYKMKSGKSGNGWGWTGFKWRLVFFLVGGGGEVVTKKGHFNVNSYLPCFFWGETKSIWNTNQDTFPHSSALPDMSEHASCFPKQRFTRTKQIIPLKITTKVTRASAAFDGYLKKKGGGLDCDDSISLTRAPMHLLSSGFAKVRGQRLCVWGCFPLVFPIAMLHWLPVTQGSDQYWVLRAAKQASERTRRRMCSIGCVMLWPRAGLSTVANAVQPSQGCFSSDTIPRLLADKKRQMKTKKQTDAFNRLDGQVEAWPMNSLLLIKDYASSVWTMV